MYSCITPCNVSPFMDLVHMNKRPTLSQVVIALRFIFSVYLILAQKVRAFSCFRTQHEAPFSTLVQIPKVMKVSPNYYWPIGYVYPQHKRTRIHIKEKRDTTCLNLLQKKYFDNDNCVMEFCNRKKERPNVAWHHIMKGYLCSTH